MEMKADKATLSIKATRPDDAGSYRCVATNQVGTVQSEVDVNLRKRTGAPKFEEKPKNTEAKEGEKVTLVVRVSGEPELTWYKDGKFLKMSDRITVECLDKDKGTYGLQFDDVKCSDSGRYKCVANNTGGESFCSASLMVKETISSPEFGEVSPAVDIKEGEDLGIEIPVSGKPLAKVTWYKDNVQLYSTARCKIQKVGDVYKLTIRQATGQDSGVYKAVAKSSAGSATKEIHVTITGSVTFFKLASRDF